MKLKRNNFKIDAILVQFVGKKQVSSIISIYMKEIKFLKGKINLFVENYI